MKIEIFSPNMANSSFVRIIIYMAMKNANILQFGQFSHRRIVLKKPTPPPPGPKKEKKKKKALGEKAMNEGCNEWETEPCMCVAVFCEICSTDGVRPAERNFTHQAPSLSLSSRAHKTKTSSAHLASP